MTQKDDTSFNPFAALVAEDTTAITKKSTQHISIEEIQLNNLISSVFSFTIDPDAGTKDNPLLFLQELAENFQPKKTLDLDLLEQALFERLLLEEPEASVVPSSSHASDSTACEQQVIQYLYNSYANLKNTNISKELYTSLQQLIMNNIVTAFKQPDLYPAQDLGQQLATLSQNCEEYFNSFLNDVVHHCLLDDEGISTIKPYTDCILKTLALDLSHCMIELIEPSCVNTLQTFTQNPHLANILLDFCTIPDQSDGKMYEQTIIGQLLNISILKKSPTGEVLYFNDPLYIQRSSMLEGHLWTLTSTLINVLHDVFLNLVKCSPEVKDKTLTWIGKCLKANSTRGNIWNAAQADGESINKCVSDAFMVNLAIVLLTLCEPFCNLSNDVKLLKVDPTYCAVTAEQLKSKEIHFSLNEETCLVPNETESERPVADKYSFITECFYLAHRAVDLGIRVAVEKVVKLQQEMSRMQRTFNEIMSEMGAASSAMESLKKRMESQMSQFYCFKTTLLQPKVVDLLMLVLTSTSHWLTQVCVTFQFKADHFQPQVRKTVKFPLPENIPATLQCIPEMIIENILCYLTFIQRFSPDTFEKQNYTNLSPLLTFLLMFMGSPQRIRNPHLRAKMAEALEALLPYRKDDPSGATGAGYQREKLFTEHPHRVEIVTNLLEVFVGIEMTGESVQFEQKFHYRRPMYQVMKYLMGVEEHKQRFKTLAEQAHANMEAVKPPLFLRFVNLLINDAIFLLDEALSNMSQLRTMQSARDNGEWNSLSVVDRATNYNYIQHTGMLARFDNILSKDTINTLVQLTSDITLVFTHPTMVDRMAAMLNYFLLSLVGPNKKNFKVKDQKEYEFDPAGTVMDICKLYINLKDCESFCMAVSQDGRSYSPQLFVQAEGVLARIGGGNMLSDLREVARRVAVKAERQQQEQEAQADAPDEFLDPIMSTLMLDPVQLPSSKQIVDRTTIARHLLSDQSDPFNRSPLTMDQIVPDDELRRRIHEWMHSKTSDVAAAAAAAQSSSATADNHPPTQHSV